MIFGLYGNDFLSTPLSLLFLAILYYFYGRNKKFNIPLILISSGTVSNLLDRYIWGGVVDFIKILSYPVFNLADILIAIGLILIAYLTLKID